MALLVASFCNRTRTGDAMLAVREPSGEWRPIYHDTAEPISACGIAADRTHVYCSYSFGGESYLAICDARASSIVETMPLAGVRDVHSIALDGEAIIVASTGTDEIVRVDLSAASREVLWRASAANTDTHHVNGVLAHEGRLLCSAFGRRIGPSWADAVDGYIYDISSGEYRARGIYHPHSLAAYAKELYVCESARGAVRSLQSDVAYLAGYARGLTIAGDGSYVAGCSVARRAVGAAYANPADAGDREGRCAVYFGSLHDLALTSESLEHLGAEIYDLVAIG